MMHVEACRNAEQWESFVCTHKEGSFLQSWHWGALQEKLGIQIIRWLVKDGDLIMGGVSAHLIQARRGIYLFLPYGPLLPADENRKSVFFALNEELARYAKRRKCSFIRLSPFWDKTSENLELLENAGFRLSPIHSKAEITWMLDLRQDTETILMNMKKGHRYLIRQGEKIGLKTSNLQNAAGIDTFYAMQLSTAKRHRFTPFSLNLWKQQFEIFSSKGLCFLKWVYYEGKPIAGAFIMLYGNTASYHYGASFPHDPKLPASYILLWECIKEAQQNGCHTFNFWGIAPDDSKTGMPDPKHPFAGITHFKRGFGGEKKELMPSYDLPLSWKYWFTYALEYLRRKKRGF